MTAVNPVDIPVAIRSALTRKDLAATRHRAALARLLALSESEVLALQYIARSGRLTSSQLGSRLGLTSGGVTALVHRLERAGHVLREPHPADRRSTLLRLSAAVELSIAGALAPLVEQVDALTAALSEEELQAIGRFLHAVADVAEREAEALGRRADEAQTESLSVPDPGLWA